MKSKIKIPFVGFAAVLLLLSSSRIFAAYDAFLYINGIQGEATASGHSNEIVVLSFSESVSNTVSINSSGGGTSSPAFGNLTIVKTLDKASPQLYLDCAQGARISQVILTLRDQTGGQVEFYKITLTGVFVTSVQTGGSSSDGARPTETITLEFQQIQWTYQQVDGNGNPVGAPIQTIFNLSSPAG
jgi:type VI secretion system secreted protein Hcp